MFKNQTIKLNQTINWMKASGGAGNKWSVRWIFFRWTFLHLHCCCTTFSIHLSQLFHYRCILHLKLILRGQLVCSTKSLHSKWCYLRWSKIQVVIRVLFRVEEGVVGKDGVLFVVMVSVPKVVVMNLTPASLLHARFLDCLPVFSPVVPASTWRVSSMLSFLRRLWVLELVTLTRPVIEGILLRLPFTRKSLAWNASKLSLLTIPSIF